MKRASSSLLLAALLVLPPGPAATPARSAVCTPHVSQGYAQRLQTVVRSGRDVLGDRLLAAAGGPTLGAAERLLPPLLFAAGRNGSALTTSGVYYLPFTQPVSVGGARGFGLHVADGSQIIVRRVGGPTLDIHVGGELYGSCLARLQAPRLAEGFLPILQVGYVDPAGVRYVQESFVGRIPGSRSLVSFVHVSADGTRARAASRIQLTTSQGRQRIVTPVARGSTTEVDAAFVHSGGRLRKLDADAYAAAQASVVGFWKRTLESHPSFVVPESRVVEVERALLIQELFL